MPKHDEARKEATEMQADDARLSFSELINRVGYAGDRIVITRYGKRSVALISIADFDRLQALESTTV